MRIGIIGASGYWGSKILKSILSFQDVEVVVCSGYSSLDKLKKAINETGFSKSPQLTLNYEEVLEKDIDAVFIATPAETHFEITYQALDAGKHVFLEKPFCLNGFEAEQLSEFSMNQKKLLMVDHTLLHSKCIKLIKQLLDENRLGEKILFFDSRRTNLGFYRKHNVLWDLGVHDLALIKYLFPNEIIRSIHVTGFTSFANVIDSVFLRFSFMDELNATVFLSYCHPRDRKITIAGTERVLVFENPKDLRVIEYRMLENNPTKGPKWDLSPKEIFVEPYDEPLLETLKCFLDHARNPEKTIPKHLTPQFATEVVQTLEAIESSLEFKSFS
jgi:predicted dehydrogenase